MRLIGLFFCAWLMMPGLSNAETRRLDPFDTVVVAADVTVHLRLADTFELQTNVVRGDAERLSIEISEQTLTVSRIRSGAVDDDRFAVHVFLPELVHVTASLGAHVIIPELTANVFSANVETGSFVELPNAQLGSVALDAATGGDIRISGRCRDLIAIASTGAQILADHMTCGSVDLDASSGAILRAFASKTADVFARTGATMVLSGTAVVRSKTVESWAKFRNWSKPPS